LLATAVSGQEERPEANGTVEVIVRDPHGKPLAGSAVEIMPLERDSWHNHRATIKTTTNAQGQARFAMHAGVDRIRIAAKGVGYCVTGVFEVLEGKTARPPVPALVPFAVIDGTVPRAILQPGIYVRLSDWDGDEEQRLSCDDQGKFVKGDLRCGRYWLRAYVGDTRFGEGLGVRLEPGQRLHVHLPDSKAEAQSEVRPDQPKQPVKEKEVTWAAGTVRDERGRTIEGATVFVIASYHGGMRMYETVRSVHTDNQGRWEIKGEGGLSMLKGSLLAYKPGRPPAIHPLPVPNWEVQKKKEEQHRNVELILPAQGGRLEVAVQTDGKPLAGAEIQLQATHGPWLYRPDYVGAARERDRALLEPILQPTVTADADGVARFRDLLPGVYDIHASSREEKAQRDSGQWPGIDRTLPHAVRRGIPIRAKETRKYKLVAYPQLNLVTFRVLQPDGKPVINRTLSFTWSTVVGGGGTSSIDLDANGVGRHFLETPGLWEIGCRYLDSPLRYYPMRETPYYEAGAIFAVSPLLENCPTKVMTAYRYEPGVLIVHVQDIDGKPARGAVVVDQYSPNPVAAGSTDDKGVVRFEGVQAGTQSVEGHLASVNLPELGTTAAEFPRDEELIGKAVFFKQKVTTRDLRQTQLAIRPSRVGYIRGNVRPPKGRCAADYEVRCDPGDWDAGFKWAYDKQTGTFVLGPLAEGKTKVRVHFTEIGNWATCGSKEIDVHNDRVAHVDFTPPAEAKPGDTGVAPEWIVKKPPRVHGHVFLSDGRTPAAGAELAAFLPELWTARDQGQTNVHGKIHMQKSAGYDISAHDQTPPGSPQEPVIVTWLPGACGATITPLAWDGDQELKLVLPPPLKVLGRVTVGGKTINGQKNQFRVLAAYEGKGKLNHLLSLDVSAEADGSFELAGLTPGIYRIQAAMDGIWLSREVRLIVKPDMANPKPLTLDIGEPGQPSVLELVRRDGKPAPAKTVKIIRPEGPLTDLLWPVEFTADGAGIIYVPSLEVGTHRVRVDGAGKDTKLAIQPLTETQGKPLNLRIVVE